MSSPTFLPPLSFHAPRDLATACQLLDRAGSSVALLAGGTDLLVKMKQGLIEASTIVSLHGVGGLDQVKKTASGGLCLGSRVTMTQLAEHPLLLDGPWSGVAEGAAVVGGPLIRNRATVGGNIVNARPCADTVPPLMCAGARLCLTSSDGERQVDLDGFVVGPGQTQIKPGEILRVIELPAPTRRQVGSAYVKITRRAAMEVTIVGCAAWVTLTKDGQQIEQARLVLTSVAPVPLRVAPAEAILEHQPLQTAVVERAAARAGELATPIDDHRCTAAYRQEVAAVICRRALFRAIARAGGTLS